MKKKASTLVFIFLLAFLILSQSTTAARLLPSDQTDQGVKVNGSPIKTKEDSVFNLMDLEECDDKDEDCLSRRVVAEAHLDYIYTQHHKPKASP
ncbi:hypothetical protein RJ640_030961 [Escallonia rubra]|uniref:Phytosulfokine n=1 Tax=Escallonia rubra TaxID=112253 RepID=A0AA88R2A5_9ASTE|nr:hypothetical protein RJ640_030961 [Escallonia rubra]